MLKRSEKLRIKKLKNRALALGVHLALRKAHVAKIRRLREAGTGMNRLSRWSKKDQPGEAL